MEQIADEREQIHGDAPSEEEAPIATWRDDDDDTRGRREQRKCGDTRVCTHAHPNGTVVVVWPVVRESEVYGGRSTPTDHGALTAVIAAAAGGSREDRAE